MTKKLKRKPRIALIVLGMHRSGTSALAGALQMLGCDGPRTVMKPTADNPLGYFESDKIYQLHNELLNSVNSRWDDWLPMSRAWLNSVEAKEYRLRAVKVITSEFGDSRLFVLKDPRICRLVPFWETVLMDAGVKARYVLIHRNPIEVAQSLVQRNGITFEIALLIWLRHMLDAEVETRESRRAVVSYSQLIASWPAVAKKITDDLNVSFPRIARSAYDEVDSFISVKLRHNLATTENVNNDPRTEGWVQTVYQIFERWVEKKENPEDYAILDQVRLQYDASGLAFARPIQKIYELGKDLQRMASIRDELTKELNLLNHEKSREREELITQHGAELEDILAKRDALAEKEKKLTDTIARQDAAIIQARSERDRIATEKQDLKAKFEEVQAGQEALIDEKKAQAEVIERLRYEFATKEAKQAESYEELILKFEKAAEAREVELADARTNLENLNRTLAEKTSEYVNGRNRHQDAIREVRSERDSLARAVEDHSRECEFLHSELKELRNQLLKQEQLVASAQGALEERRADSVRAEAEIVALRDRLLDREIAHANAIAESRRENAVRELEAQTALLGSTQEIERLSMKVEALELEIREHHQKLELANENATANEATAKNLENELADRQRKLAALEHLLSERNGELESSEQQIARLAESIETQDHEMAQMRSALEQRRHESSQISESLVAAELARDSALEMLARSGQNAEEREAALNSEIAEKSAACLSLERELAERQKELAKLTRLLVELEDKLTAAEKSTAAKLAASEDSVMARELERDEANETLRKQQSEVVRLREELSDLKMRIESSSITASRREEALIGELAIHQTELRAKDKRLVEQKSELALLTQMMIAREAEREKHAQEAERLAGLAQLRENERNEELNKVTQLAADGESLMKQLLEAQQATEEYRRRLEDVFKTRSWKVTSPLRSVSTMVRRITFKR